MNGQQRGQHSNEAEAEAKKPLNASPVKKCINSPYCPKLAAASAIKYNVQTANR